MVLNGAELFGSIFDGLSTLYNGYIGSVVDRISQNSKNRAEVLDHTWESMQDQIPSPDDWSSTDPNAE